MDQRVTLTRFADNWGDSARFWLCYSELNKLISIPKNAKRLHVTGSLTEPKNLKNVLIVRLWYRSGGVRVGRSKITIPVYFAFQNFLKLILGNYPNQGPIKIYLSFEWS